MKIVETLPDSDEGWGKSRVDWIFMERKKLRDIERQRRALYLQRNVAVRERNEKGRFVAPESNHPIEGEIFRTETGILAYVRKIPNRNALSPIILEHNASNLVSLPYVSILFAG